MEEAHIIPLQIIPRWRTSRPRSTEFSQSCHESLFVTRPVSETSTIVCDQELYIICSLDVIAYVTWLWIAGLIGLIMRKR